MSVLQGKFYKLARGIRFDACRTPRSASTACEGRKESAEAAPSREGKIRLPTLISPAQERIKVEGPLVLLDEATHSSLGDPAPAPDLDRVVRNLAAAPREEVLQEGHRTGEGLGLLAVRKFGPSCVHGIVVSSEPGR